LRGQRSEGPHPNPLPAGEGTKQALTRPTCGRCPPAGEGTEVASAFDQPGTPDLSR
jgi:hypothetical protein